MKDIATIPFRDVESGDKAVAIVRAQQGVIALALFLESDGDLEVFLPRAAAEALSRALDAAVRIA